ncbi:N-alpha-acetyl-L-2,4-diaminobutyrate deacetylase [Aestuariispira insulae]|uniref:N-alpha-acetyl-L-2,4-diaminobutyrate deacetylase n=2 Tax=Aestuariispira insulae TaxID=1461337 RepID=A0A3D9H2K3_9PROT|nr:N-alpha-acetyl-L-2,4-diaminobutyrate deacetylase [Aestuariispira insulae]
MKPSPINCTIPLDRDGVHHGHLKLPYSSDASAWGAIMIPISVVRRGDGPVALLTGANHGDEYEGPIALQRLINEVDPSDVTGTVIVVPAMNYPAFRKGTRTSPIDHGNLNRVFPGRPDGTVTEKIADYFQRYLLPLADWVLDIHSGGKTLEFVPFAAAHMLENKVQQQRCVEAMRAFCAPYSMMMLEIDNMGMYDTAAEDMGKVFVSTELGGGGTSSAYLADCAYRGVNNFLVHAGILNRKPDLAESTEIAMPDGECFITSENDGLLEYCVDLGQKIEAGEVIARVYDIARNGQPPALYTARRSGILAGRHFPGLIAVGDNLAVIAEIVS